MRKLAATSRIVVIVDRQGNRTETEVIAYATDGVAWSSEGDVVDYSRCSGAALECEITAVGKESDERVAYASADMTIPDVGAGGHWLTIQFDEQPRVRAGSADRRKELDLGSGSWPSTR